MTIWSCALPGSHDKLKPLISTTIMLKTIKLRRVITSYLEKLLPIKSFDPFIMRSREINGKFKKIISHDQNTYSYQTFHGGHIQSGVHITKSSHPSVVWFIFTWTRPMTTKHDKLVICHELPFIKSHDPLNTCSSKVMWQTEIIKYPFSQCLPKMD